jgi:hypothetical protein
MVPLPPSSSGLPQQPELKVLSSWTTPFRKDRRFSVNTLPSREVRSFAKPAIAKHIRVKFVAKLSPPGGFGGGI